MKIWKKIFLYSTILTMILINGVGVIIIEKIHKKNLDRAIAEAIENEKSIINSIYLNYDTVSKLYYVEDESGNLFDIIFKNYIYKNDANIKNIQILNNENKVIASLKKVNIGVKNSELLNVDLSQSKFMINTMDNEKVVSVSSVFRISEGEYKIVLSKSIDSFYKDRVANYKIFFILDIFINILLIIGMYIISKHITKPIVELANVSVDIANGEYNKRVKNNKGKDEIGILATNFNFMMEVLESKIQELQDVNDEKERFINNFTHEIKTPITSIIGYSDLLLKVNIDEKTRKKSLEYINNEGRRLENLSSSLVKLIMIKGSNIDNSIISIKECVNNAIQSLTYKIEGKNILLNVDINDEEINADKQLIVVLLINLLDNAIKACSENGNIKIIGSKGNDNFYNLYIKDNGIGIAEEEIDKIMEPFYMIDKSRSRASNGLGLGLAICKEICKLYNIDFKITSELNNGTTIKLTINMESE